VYSQRVVETQIVQIDPKNIDTGKIAKAAKLIDSGGLVAFPTETVYGIACRVKTDSLQRLNNIKERTVEKYYTLHIGAKSEVEKYVPTLGLRAKKLIERTWPGPVTIVFELSNGDIEKQKGKLESEVFENLYKDNSIGIRCCDNAVASALLLQTKNPVIAPSANPAGKPAAVEANQVIENLAGRIDMVLDGGPCKYKKSSSVVKAGKMGLEILRPGVVCEADLRKMAEVRFMFVCTGNTCRSPMAEGMFEKKLAEKLECDVDYLEKIGYKTVSAGTMGMVGAPASVEAVAACAERKVDISGHVSRALSRKLVEQSDLIFAMSAAHRERVIDFEPGAAEKCILLVEGSDVPDPIGQSRQVYDECAVIIEQAIIKRISELEL